MMQRTKPKMDSSPSSHDSLPLNDESSDELVDPNETDDPHHVQTSQQLDIAPSYRPKAVPISLPITNSNIATLTPQSSDQPHDQINIVNDKPSYLKLLTNELFYSRIIILLITIFLFILSLCYALGQILSLQLSDFWCPKRTIEEVRAHSREINSNEGDNSGCWTIKQFTVDKVKLWTAESYTSKWEMQSNELKFIAFLMISVVLLSLVSIYIHRLIIDIKLYRERKLGKKRQHRKLLRTHHTIHNTTQSSSYFNNIWCILYVHKIHNLYNTIFEKDSGFWCFKKLLMEIFEIFVQSQALLYYNGYAFFSPNDVILAEKPQYIILFAIFLSMNCIFCCIFWLFYSFKPLFCHGFVFELILYSMDVVFDIFYTLFPLIVVFQATPKILVALGSLQTDDQITFWATFLPLTFLCFSSYSFSRQARHAMEEHYGTQFLSSHLSMKTNNNTPSNNNNTPQIQMTSILSRLPSKLTGSKSWVISSERKKNQIIRKSLIVIVALMFGIYGIVLLSLVITHFNTAIPYCSSVVDELNNLDIGDGLYSNITSTKDAMLLSPNTQNILDKHPELFMYDFCEFKVYPFGNDIDGNPTCECRKFVQHRIAADEHFVWTAPELDYYFNISVIDILSATLLQWKMLENFRWSYTKSFYRKSFGDEIFEPPIFNLTSDMFIAEKMRVFEMDDTPTYYIDDKISNWKLLSYFEWHGNDEFHFLPDTFGQLTDLGYIKISSIISFTVFPDSICSLSNLRAIRFELTGITSIPHCIDQLYDLESIFMSGNVNLESLPLNAFNHKGLLEFSAFQATQIGISSIIEYNNLSNFSQFDQLFEYNKETTFGFEETSFCEDFLNGDIPSSSKFYQFIMDTNCCKRACDASSEFEAFHCKSYELANGVCDTECISSECNFDDGDCVQLCECDAINELGNGICNNNCNSTECLYDGYDCLPLGYDPIECELSYKEHQCNISWVGDGWCDSYCFNAIQCGNDLDDCGTNNCKANSQCQSVYDIFTVIANSNSNDNHVEEIELKDFWSLGLQLGILNLNDVQNYTQIIPRGDLNNDQLLNMHEIIILMHDKYGVSVNQAQQIDCSDCVGGIDDFYN